MAGFAGETGAGDGLTLGLAISAAGGVLSLGSDGASTGTLTGSGGGPLSGDVASSPQAP